MVCLYCSNELSVNNSRPQKSLNQTWRRRVCAACGAAFTSIEAIDLSKALIVSTGAPKTKTHNLSAFERDRLFISLYDSLRHRPTAMTDARGLCDTITVYIIAKATHGQISSRTIIELALDTLAHFDKAAAVHYGAYHPLHDGA